MPIPGEDGLLIPRSSYPALQETVRANKRNPFYRQMPQRRRQPVFQPSAGSKVYQCVSGTKLRLGTVLEPDRGDIYEPVAICVELGSVTSDDLLNLKNDTVFKLQDRVKQLGIIDNRNRIDKGVFDDNKDSEQFTSLVQDDIGNETGLTALRARFLDGYAPTGCMLVGNDTEAWYGSTVKTFEVTTAANWTDGTTQVLAKLKVNQSAVDAHITDNLIYDYIAVRNPIQHSLYIASGTKEMVTFRHVENLSDDQAYLNQFWFDHSDLGTLPIFDLIAPPLEFRGKATGDVTAGNTGSVVIWDGMLNSESATSVTLTGVLNDTDCTCKGTPKFCTVRRLNSGWQFTVARTA